MHNTLTDQQARRLLPPRWRACCFPETEPAMQGSFLGVRCQPNIDSHETCRNPKCACECHIGDTRRAEQLREAKSRGRKRGERKGVYHMDNPDEGELYEFEL